VGGAAAEDLGGVSQHGDRGEPDAELVGDLAPQGERPGGARVLERADLVALGQLGEGVPELRAVGVADGGQQLLLRVRATVGNTDRGALEQLVVEVDRPLRLVEPPRVGGVGRKVRSGHVHTEQ
jgi:hypothetical protein